MKASKMINRLQKLIEKHGDFDVSMLSFIIENKSVGETLQPIRQIKYRKKFEKFICDNTGGF